MLANQLPPTSCGIPRTTISSWLLAKDPNDPEAPPVPDELRQKVLAELGIRREPKFSLPGNRCMHTRNSTGKAFVYWVVYHPGVERVLQVPPDEQLKALRERLKIERKEEWISIEFYEPRNACKPASPGLAQPSAMHLTKLELLLRSDTSAGIPMTQKPLPYRTNYARKSVYGGTSSLMTIFRAYESDDSTSTLPPNSRRYIFVMKLCNELDGIRRGPKFCLPGDRHMYTRNMTGKAFAYWVEYHPGSESTQMLKVLPEAHMRVLRERLKIDKEAEWMTIEGRRRGSL
ncbi:hypothetical protein Moror_8819 [Moniliophthora roreri MCA 2997]|uniref:Uncharacterized protein n=1 Tax=Moniliophthora roreri (strain MCA 2997) TaxID=1381753 RepID=V2XJR8_MONRO|nr:hypothetical protein Moror_8819 [Moniliophthora roreri MCA 2997]